MFQLAGQAHGQGTETGQLGIPMAPASLRQMGRDRRARPSSLPAQSLQFFARKAMAQIFGVRQHQRLRGQRHSLLENLEHGHAALSVGGQSLVAPRYEKFSTFLRLELCVHRLQALGLNKGLDHRDALPRNWSSPPTGWPIFMDNSST